MIEYEQPLLAEPLGFDADSDVWDVPWLDELRCDIPPEAVWPRLMSVPHPSAVGSYGAEAAAWAYHNKRRWRWWQYLAAARILEHDKNGQLCWFEALLTVARQLGKSWLVSDLCQWRMEEGDRFGGPQLVVQTSREIASTKEMSRFWRALMLSQPKTYRVSQVNGQESAEVRATGARTLIRSKSALYGLSVDFAVTDEAWALPAATVDEGLVPTMVARPNGQLLITSTAHRKSTALVIGRRATALSQLGDPDDAPLLIEWSTPRDCELDDRDGWRQASPHWDQRRERLMARRLNAVMSGESEDVDEPDPVESFASQWLNRWPQQRTKTGKGEPLLEVGQWKDLQRDLPYSDASGYVAIEDNFGHGAACAVVIPLPDGTYELGGEQCESWDQAQRLARKMLDAHPGSRLLVGASLIVDTDILGKRHTVPCKGLDTRRGLSLFREMVRDRRVLHDRSRDLDEQIEMARVVKAADGLALVPGPRGDVLKCALWALRRAETKAPMPSVH